MLNTRTVLRTILIATLSNILLIGCGGGSDDGNAPPPTGTLNITIVDGTSDPLTGILDANIILLDGTGDPVNNFNSDINGVVTQQTLNVGSYQLKVSANGFSPSPAPRVPPLPVQIVGNQTTDITITLYPLANANTLGTITGNIADTFENSVAGALIIAEIDSTTSVTTISAADGSYILHNVPEGTADLTAFIGGFNFRTLTGVGVAAGEITPEQNIDAVSVATGTISGSVNFVAGGSVVAVDVTLLDPVTREVIPGMRVYIDITDNNSYTMSGMPDGRFEIIASLENDGIVIDPDEAVTQGTPIVDVAGGSVTPTIKDFKVTGAVELDTPATPTNNIIPELSTTPSFTWHSASSYSSLTEYVIEVVNESGDTIWGGFDPVTGLPRVTVPKETTTIDYNDGGTGNALVYPLDTGRYYQLRIYASKDVTVSDTYPLGFKLLSLTETLDGVFKVE